MSKYYVYGYDDPLDCWDYWRQHSFLQRFVFKPFNQFPNKGVFGYVDLDGINDYLGRPHILWSDSPSDTVKINEFLDEARERGDLKE